MGLALDSYVFPAVASLVAICQEDQDGLHEFSFYPFHGGLHPQHNTQNNDAR